MYLTKGNSLTKKRWSAFDLGFTGPSAPATDRCRPQEHRFFARSRTKVARMTKYPTQQCSQGPERIRRNSSRTTTTTTWLRRYGRCQRVLAPSLPIPVWPQRKQTNIGFCPKQKKGLPVSHPIQTLFVGTIASPAKKSDAKTLRVDGDVWSLPEPSALAI